MNIIESLKWRYATKKFDSTKILPEEKMEILTEAFNLTATSYGLQPVKLVVVQNKKIQEQLIQYSWNQRQVADASHLLIICTEKNVSEQYITDYFKTVKKIRNTPEEILKPFKDELIASFTEKPEEEIQNWAAKQAYLALGNLLTVCALEKIDACPMEGFIPDKYDALLSLSSLGLTSVLVLPVGYRSDNDMFATLEKVRKPMKDSIITMK